MNIRPNSVAIAIFATIVQYYDYALYSFSAVILSEQFFPSNSSVANLKNAYLVLALSILTKPIGSYIIAYIGDKFGRSAALKISAIGIAIPTFVIGILPPFEKIGFLSTFILFASRMLITAFASAELDGVRIYIFEKLDKQYSYLGNALVSISTQVGAILAIFATWIVSDTSLWRMNFIIGGVFGFIVFCLRHYILETEEYIHAKSENQEFQVSDFMAFCYSIIILGIIGAIYHFNVIFFGSYAFKILQIANANSAQIVTILMLISYAIGAVIAGVLCDRFGRESLVIKLALYCTLVVGIWNIFLLANREYIWLVYILISFLIPSYSVPLQVIIQKIIHTSFRYRFYSLAHAIGAGLISSTTPYFATKIYEKTELSWMPSIYFLFLLLMLFVFQALLFNFIQRSKS